MDFYVVADEDTVAGFRYAGVEGIVARSPGKLGDVLDRMVEEGRQVILITTETLAESVREKVNAIRYGGAFPLIVEIPGPLGPSEEAPSLVKMIRDAVGIRV